MSMEMMEQQNDIDAREARETLYLLSGAAMVVFGAGLILSTPTIRRMIGGAGVGNLVQAAIPDFQRYMRLRAM